MKLGSREYLSLAVVFFLLTQYLNQEYPKAIQATGDQTLFWCALLSLTLTIVFFSAGMIKKGLGGIEQKRISMPDVSNSTIFVTQQYEGRMAIAPSFVTLFVGFFPLFIITIFLMAGTLRHLNVITLDRPNEIIAPAILTSAAIGIVLAAWIVQRADKKP